MTILPKAIYRFNAILVKNTNDMFHRTRTKYIKFCMETQNTLSSQTNHEKTNGTGEIMCPVFRLYYKDTIIKTAWYRHKNRNIALWNSIETPEINPHPMVNYFTRKEAGIYNGEKEAFLLSGAWIIGQPHVKEWPLDENIGRTHFDINHRNVFFDPHLRVMKIKAKINK